MNIEEILNQIPLFIEKKVIHEPLNGGLSNPTYKLACEGKRYVLRIFGGQVEFLPLTRGSEIEVARLLNKKANTLRYRRGIPLFAAKLLTDALLFLVSYGAQRKFVY